MTAEMTYNKSAVIRKEYIDDGTTGGKTMYQTADGKWWEETNYIPVSCTAGTTIGRLEGNNIRY